MIPGPDPIKLHFWQGVANFGDVLSAHLVAHVSGRGVDHAGPRQADLFALGSLLQVARRKHKEPRADGSKPWIWGAGLLHAVPKDFVPNVQIALLRGPITAALMGVTPRHFGDPGLLAPDLLSDCPEQQDRIGIVAHHSQAQDPALRALCASDPAYQWIDVGDDALEVCRQIATCRHVFASSLHGLIVADAFGVSNDWIDPGTQSHLKYFDYAASIGRGLTCPLATTDIPARRAALKDRDVPYQTAIAQCRQALLDSFPDDLRATSKTSATLMAAS